MQTRARSSAGLRGTLMAGTPTTHPRSHCCAFTALLPPRPPRSSCLFKPMGDQCSVATEGSNPSCSEAPPQGREGCGHRWRLVPLWPPNETLGWLIMSLTVPAWPPTEGGTSSCPSPSHEGLGGPHPTGAPPSILWSPFLAPGGCSSHCPSAALPSPGPLPPSLSPAAVPWPLLPPRFLGGMSCPPA